MDRLYAGGSSLDRGTLLQLRNLINRRNVAKDVTGRFNATVDFLETVVDCHIVAAAMNFFGMKAETDVPSNAFPVLPDSAGLSTKWRFLENVIGEIVDRYMFIQDYVNVSKPGHAFQ